MKQVAQFLITAFFLTATNIGLAQGKKIEEIRNECVATSFVIRPNLLITPFAVSASFQSYGAGNMVAEKLISHLGTVSCFEYNKTISHFITAGSQVVITGVLKDYYTSEGVLGKPRIEFDLEIRKAINSRELLASKNIKGFGKFYTGIGNNKPLAALWNQVLDEAIIFLYGQFPLIMLQTKAESEVIKTGPSEVSIDKRANRKSVLEQMEDHSEKKREENWKRNMMLSDYHNDSALYNEFPKKPSEEFLEYSVNGKKYLFKRQMAYAPETATFNAIEGVALTKHGLQIMVTPSYVTCFPQIDMFYPADYPKARRFHFGNDSTYDERVMSIHQSKITFELSLPVTCVEKLKPMSTEKFFIFGSTDPKKMEQNNIEGGYVQVLMLQTSRRGTIECYFKFKTKAYTDKDGKKVPAYNIEGRFRVKGSFSAPRTFSYEPYLINLSNHHS